MDPLGLIAALLPALNLVVGFFLARLLPPRKSLTQRYAEEQLAIEAEAERFVRAAEQEIKVGRLDSSSAKAQGVAHLMRVFGLERDQAGRMIEASVYALGRA